MRDTRFDDFIDRMLVLLMEEGSGGAATSLRGLSAVTCLRHVKLMHSAISVLAVILSFIICSEYY
jgi:hypothetical protein